MSIREDIKAYLDGELSPERMLEVRAALQADPELRRDAEFMQELGVEIRSLSADPEIVGMDRVLGAMAARRAGRVWFLPVRAWAGAAAVVVLVAIAGAFLRSGQTKGADVADRAASAKSAQPSMGASTFRGAVNLDSSVVGQQAISSAPEAPQADVKSFSDVAGPHPKDTDSSGAGVSKSTRSVIANAGDYGITPVPGTVVVASISIEASDVDEAEAALRRAAEGAGGYAEPATVDERSGRASKKVALSVPAPRLDAAIRDIKSIGHVLYQNFGAIDVGLEKRNVANRLQALRKQATPADASKRNPISTPKLDQESQPKEVLNEIGNLEQRQKSLNTPNPMPVIIATIEAVTPGMPPARKLPRPPAKPKSRLPLAVGGGVALVAVGGAGYLWLRSRRFGARTGLLK